MTSDRLNVFFRGTTKLLFVMAISIMQIRTGEFNVGRSYYSEQPPVGFAEAFERAISGETIDYESLLGLRRIVDPKIMDTAFLDAISDRTSEQGTGAREQSSILLKLLQAMVNEDKQHQIPAVIALHAQHHLIGDAKIEALKKTCEAVVAVYRDYPPEIELHETYDELFAKHFPGQKLNNSESKEGIPQRHPLDPRGVKIEVGTQQIQSQREGAAECAELEALARNTPKVAFAARHPVLATCARVLAFPLMYMASLVAMIVLPPIAQAFGLNQKLATSPTVRVLVGKVFSHCLRKTTWLSYFSFLLTPFFAVGALLQNIDPFRGLKLDEAKFMKLLDKEPKLFETLGKTDPYKWKVIAPHLSNQLARMNEEAGDISPVLLKVFLRLFSALPENSAFFRTHSVAINQLVYQACHSKDSDSQKFGKKLFDLNCASNARLTDKHEQIFGDKPIYGGDFLFNSERYGIGVNKEYFEGNLLRKAPSTMEWNAIAFTDKAAPGDDRPADIMAVFAEIPFFAYAFAGSSGTYLLANHLRDLGLGKYYKTFYDAISKVHYRQPLIEVGVQVELKVIFEKALEFDTGDRIYLKQDHLGRLLKRFKFEMKSQVEKSGLLFSLAVIFARLSSIESLGSEDESVLALRSYASGLLNSAEKLNPKLECLPPKGDFDEFRREMLTDRCSAIISGKMRSAIESIPELQAIYLKTKPVAI